MSAQELVPVAEPAIDTMEPGARTRIEAARRQVEGALSQGDREAGSAAFDELGRLYLAFELFEAAAAAFDNASRLDPRRVSALYHHGICLAARGDPEGAVVSFERFLDAETHGVLRSAALARLGEAALELDRLELARRSYASALEIDPAHPGALYGRARVDAAEGRHDEAIRAFRRVLEMQSEATVVHYPLGQSLRRAGDRDAAREHLRQRGDGAVLFEDPLADEIARLAVSGAFEAVATLAAVDEGFDERAYLGFVLAQFGEMESAIEPLRGALVERVERTRRLEGAAAKRERLTQGRIHYALGGLLVKHRRDSEAEPELRRAVELAPQLRDAHVKLANLLVRTGRRDEAEREYTLVLEAFPDDVAALLKRGALRMQAGREREAAEDLRRVLELDPQQVEALLRLGRTSERLGDVAEARRLYVRGLQLEIEAREAAALHYELGRLDQRDGHAEAALSRYGRAVDADPTLLAARLDRATLLGRLGRFREASAAYRELLEIEPRHELARLGEATALAIVGDTRSAAERLDEGVARLPESAALAHALARLLASTPDPEVRDGERATELARQVVSASPTPEHVETLAMALAATGRFEDALAVQERLLEQMRPVASPAEVSRLDELRGLYASRRACCFPKEGSR